jgi:hypothetical protein
MKNNSTNYTQISDKPFIYFFQFIDVMDQYSEYLFAVICFNLLFPNRILFTFSVIQNLSIKQFLIIIMLVIFVFLLSH